MKITATGNTMVGGISIMIGTYNYAGIDHKKPSHREELRILRDMGKISFKEILEGDEDVRKRDKEVEDSGKSRVASVRKRTLSKKKESDVKKKKRSGIDAIADEDTEQRGNEGSARGTLPE